MADRVKRSANQPAKPATPNDPAAGEQVRLQLLSGDWGAVKASLAAMPADAVPLVYGHMLTLLAGSEATLVMPAEIVAIADAAPQELEPAHLVALGQLLARAAQATDRLDAFMDTLHNGTERLGGENPTRRMAAARLLMAARQFDEAAAFLPPIDDALEAKDAPLLNLHALLRHQRGLAYSEPKALLDAWAL